MGPKLCSSGSTYPARSHLMPYTFQFSLLLLPISSQPFTAPLSQVRESHVIPLDYNVPVPTPNHICKFHHPSWILQAPDLERKPFLFLLPCGNIQMKTTSIILSLPQTSPARKTRTDPAPIGTSSDFLISLADSIFSIISLLGMTSNRFSAFSLL